MAVAVGGRNGNAFDIPVVLVCIYLEIIRA
jgi:hypothetical protein